MRMVGFRSPSKFQLHIHLTQASSEALGTQPGVGNGASPQGAPSAFSEEMKKRRRVDRDKPGSCEGLSGAVR